MKKEELLELGLTEEQVDKVFALNGKAIEAQKALTLAETAKLDAANETIKKLQETVKRFDGVDVEKLKADLASAQEKYTADLSRLQLDRALDMALLTGKARDVKAMRALLDIDKIKFDNDKLSGLDEQLEALRQSHGYMFEADQQPPKIRVDTGKEHNDAQKTTPTTLAGALKERYDMKG